jgi:hypothetical protein
VPVVVMTGDPTQKETGRGVNIFKPFSLVVHRLL